MPLDPKLQKLTTASPAIASYDFVDILDGTGTIIFQGFTTDAGAFILSQSQPFSRDIEVTRSGTAGDWVVFGTDNFDLSPFNIPQTIRGVAIVNISHHAIATGSSRFVIKIKKGSTELASVTTNSIGAGEVLNHCVSLTIPRTDFAVGDVLRLTIISQATGTGAQTMYYGADPQNRDADNLKPSVDPLTTKLEFHCPFELNI